MSEFDKVGITKNWEVTVSVDGEPVLTIGSGHLSGESDIDPFKKTISNAAICLLSFIGNGEEDDCLTEQW